MENDLRANDITASSNAILVNRKGVPNGIPLTTITIVKRPYKLTINYPFTKAFTVGEAWTEFSKEDVTLIDLIRMTRFALNSGLEREGVKANGGTCYTAENPPPFDYFSETPIPIDYPESNMVEDVRDWQLSIDKFIVTKDSCEAILKKKYKLHHVEETKDDKFAYVEKIIQKDSILTFILKHHSQKIAVNEDIEQEADNYRNEMPGLVPDFFFYETVFKLRVIGVQGSKITAEFTENIIFNGVLENPGYDYTFYLFEVDNKYYFQRCIDWFIYPIENLQID